MKPVIFKNRVNNDEVVCNDIRDIEVIDNVEYYKVHRYGQDRTFLMRKEALEKIDKKVKE